MKQRKTKISWLLTHRYRNGGFIRGGIIANNPIKCDVIALGYTYTDFKTGKWRKSSHGMSIDEAMCHIEVLARAVGFFTETNRKIPPKPTTKKSAKKKQLYAKENKPAK